MNCTHCFKPIDKPYQGFEIEYSPDGSKTYWHTLCAIHAFNMMDALKIKYYQRGPDRKHPDEWGKAVVAEEWREVENYWKEQLRAEAKYHAQETELVKRQLSTIYKDIAMIQPPAPIVLQVENPEEFLRRWKEK